MESERKNVQKVVLNDSDYPTLRDSFTNPGVRLLFIVSSHVGIRASELKRICWEQVDFERKVIRLERGTKNKDPRSAPIFGDMVEALTAAKRERDEFYPDSPWVFSRGGEPIQTFRNDWSTQSRRLVYPTSTST
jgi:integrase